MTKLRKVLIISAVASILGACTCPRDKAGKKLTIVPDANLKPELFSDLGEGFTVPDGLALDKNNNLFLAVPNYIDWEKNGSKIVKFDKHNRPANWFTALPKHPETGEVHPMGIEFGPDGNLYIADNQYFVNKDHKSRLLRIVVKDGKAVKCEVVVEGFKLANAVRWKGNDVYVSDTHFDLKKKHQSGIYRISLAEMNKGLVKLKPNATDSHLLCTFTAKDFGSDEETAGADGITFDSKGNLYCGNFGDGVISRLTFKNNGSVKSQQVVVNHPSIECCDGIICDPKTDKIYITNSKNNSVHVYDTVNNSLQLLWINNDDNGATGLLDQPCEPILRGNKLIVVNFDMTFPGLKNKENDEYNTLSVFNLK